MGYSFRLAARVLLYASSHRQDNRYHDLCYTSRGALAGTRTSSMGPPHEGSIRRPIVPWANALTTELHFNPKRSRRYSQSENVKIRYTYYMSFFSSQRGKEGTILIQDAFNMLCVRLYGVGHKGKNQQREMKFTAVISRDNFHVYIST